MEPEGLGSQCRTLFREVGLRAIYPLPLDPDYGAWCFCCCCLCQCVCVNFLSTWEQRVTPCGAEGVQESSVERSSPLHPRKTYLPCLRLGPVLGSGRGLAFVHFSSHFVLLHSCVSDVARAETVPLFCQSSHLVSCAIPLVWHTWYQMSSHFRYHHHHQHHPGLCSQQQPLPLFYAFLLILPECYSVSCYCEFSHVYKRTHSVYKLRLQIIRQ